MRAYSMDLRERALLDSDAGMKAAEHECRRLVSRISGASRGPAPGDHCSTSIAAIAAGFVP